VWPRRAAILALLALLYTALNAFIPFQIDDAAYIRYARQAAEHPLDPYGFVMQWYDVPEPANNVLAPPVLPYSIAPAVWLFGERPALVKLALLPWALLLTFALHSHLHRFAPGLELHLTAFLLFSPALLPSLNLMLDVPALALTLLSIRVFLQACDRGSIGRALLAGSIAAVAMQTKYTGVLALGAIAAATIIYRRPRPGLAAVAIASAGFIAVEIFVATRYGRSHFLTSLERNSTTLAERANLIPLFFSHLGGVAPAVVLLGLTALGVTGRRVVATAGLMLAGYATITLLDASYVGMVHPSSRVFGTVDAAPWKFQLAEVLFDAVTAVLTLALFRAMQRLTTEPAGPGLRDTYFLLAWLAVEAAGYLMLTPFPAVRRVLGAFVVITIIFGRLATRTCITPERRRLVNGIFAFGMILSLAYLGIDWLGARAYQRAAEDAAAFIRDNGGGRVWYIGRWGFRYYAERSGMTPLVPRYDPPASYIDLPSASLLRSGDWLVVTKEAADKPALNLAAVPREEAGRVVIEDSLPLRTVPCFYGGRTPLEHHEGPRITVHIYRITSDCEIELFVPVDGRQ
jgi:hypothetical protein